MTKTFTTLIEDLKRAEAIRALEFYMCRTDGNFHSFSCRCWDALNHKDSQKLVRELNEAIEPIKKRWIDSILNDVTSTIDNRDIP